MSRALGLIALGALACLGAPPQVSAADLCDPCAPVAHWAKPRAYYSGSQFYVVNEGPTFSGPGVITLPPNYYPYPYWGSDCCVEDVRVRLYHHGVPHRRLVAYPMVGGYRHVHRTQVRVLLPSEK
jgi:hypothetical protein